MRTRGLWQLAWYVGGLLGMGCVPSPGVTSPELFSAAEKACKNPGLRWSGPARAHVTARNDSLTLLPEALNYTWTEADIDSGGRVLALVVIERGSVRFRRHTASTGDSVCVFFQGKYPQDGSPNRVVAAFVRKRDAVAMEAVQTRIRIGTPHTKPEVDWIADYDSPAGMLPFPAADGAAALLMMAQTACPGGCCTAKKPL